MPNVRQTRAITGKAARLADQLEKQFGRPKPGVRRPNPLDTLIATILSQNTNDRNSYRAWLSLRKAFTSWAAVDRASWQQVARVIEVGGLKNQKAKRIKKILRNLKAHEGEYSLDFLKRRSNEEATDYLLEMKGVGQKTAACVLVFSLGRDVFPVDTHIHRICNRLGLVKTSTAEETFTLMQSLVPPGRSYPFHVNLIQLGRKVCKSVNPHCGQCILFEECAFPKKFHYMEYDPGRRRHARKSNDFLITEKIAAS